jgi:hypothetical protein
VAKGKTVPKVTRLTYGDNAEDAPTWERVKNCLLALRDEKSATVEVNDETWLIVLRSALFGYLVTGLSEGEKSYYTLIERTLGDEPVTVFDGGNLSDFPRHSFVSEPLMLKAVGMFYSTGERDRDCEWVPDRDAMY